MYLHEVMSSVFSGKLAYRLGLPDEIVFYLGPNDYSIKPSVAEEIGIAGCPMAPALAKRTVDGMIALFVPSQIDMTFEDWELR